MILETDNLVYDGLMLAPVFGSLPSDLRSTAVAEKARVRIERMLDTLEAARIRRELPRYLEQPVPELLDKLDMER